MKTVEQIRAEVQNFSFSDYLRYSKDIEQALIDRELKPLRIAVLRSYTVEMIKPVLRFRLLLEGYDTEFFFGDYNKFYQEILSPTSPLYSFKPDVILLMIRVEEIMPDFVESFGEKPSRQWESIIHGTVKNLRSLVETVEEKMPSQILIQNFALASDSYWGIYDSQNPQGQSSLVHQLNQFLANELQEKKSAFIWDFDKLVQKVGYTAIYDPKMWYISKNPFKQSGYPVIVNDLLRYILSIVGKAKKCIVLDLDNTLWGGIAGEDGIEGIALGQTYPGSCYRDFQKGLLKLYNRGVILAINSKNNEEDALEIIDKHPYMVLRREHFAAMKINWNDKASNLRALAQELNIGTDSMIFIDDSPIECELLRQHCPECEVVCLPEKKYLIPGVLDSMSGLENIKLTQEDRNKGKMYQAQVARKDFERSFKRLDDFLKSLEIEVAIESATSFSIPRIAQLTQKTNQMNLTTRRYTEANIKGFIEHPNTHAFAVSSKDRFGDNGVIGVFILNFQGEECHIDTFLLSCRVIGRNIEEVMIAFITEFAREHGAKYVIGEYLPTAKNKPAANMYKKFRFKRIGDSLYKADLEVQHFQYPTFIKYNLQVLPRDRNHPEDR